MSLAVGTITIAIFVAIPLGTIAAWRMGGWLDRLLSMFSVASFSVPIFVVGYCLIWLFALKLNWFSVQGYKRIAEGFGPWICGRANGDCDGLLYELALLAFLPIAGLLPQYHQLLAATANWQ